MNSSRISILFIAAAFLSACATTTVPVDVVTVSQTHGYVHTSLPIPGNLHLVPIDDKKKFHRLEQHSGGGFGAWLPTGTYKLDSWGLRDLAGYPDIVVEAGRITNLGGLVLFDIGGYQSILLPMRHSEMAPELQAVKTEFGPHLAVAEPIEWHPVDVPEPMAPEGVNSGQGLIIDWLIEHEQKVNRPDDVEALRNSASIDAFEAAAKSALPPTSRDAVIGDDGSRYYGTRLGQIRVRDTEGNWRTFDTGSLRSVSAVARSGGLLVAGYENGAMRSSVDGSQWTALTGHPDGDRILDIDYTGSEWLIATARLSDARINFQPGDLVRIYRGKSPGFSSLREIASFEYPKLNGPLEFFKGSLSDEHYFINIFPDLHRMDLRTGQWKVLDVGRRVWYYHLEDDGRTLTTFQPAALGRAINVSFDSGDTWAERDGLAAFKVRFDADGNGFALVNTGAGFKVRREIRHYVPATDSWVTHRELPDQCRVLVSLPGEAETLCATGNHNIWRLTDDGYVVEFSLD